MMIEASDGDTSLEPRGGARGWMRRIAPLLGAFLLLSGCQSGQVRPDPSETVSAGGTMTPSGAEPTWVEDHIEPIPMPPGHGAAASVIYRHASVPVEGPYIALTFDDGPSPSLTPQLLDILREREVRATFFVVGERVRAGRNILERMVGEGHEIGNHTWDHSPLDRMARSIARDQLMRTNYAIWAAIGQYPTLMRPPYGRSDPGLNRWIYEETGMKVVMWSVDSLDWRHRNADRVQREILAQAAPGAIILCHDIHPTTIAAMPATIDILQERGFKFVTVSELIALRAGAE